MATYALTNAEGEAVSALSVCDTAGKAYVFVFPHSTDDPDELAILIANGASEVKEQHHLKGGDR